MPTKNMLRNWERYDSENAERNLSKTSTFGYIYDLLKTEHHLTVQDYSNGLHHINLNYHVGNR